MTMRPPLFFKLLAVLGLSLSLAAQAATVGRTLVAAGQVSAARSGQNIPLVAGSPVETGDTVNSGDNSNAQIRMLDGTVLAVRPNTSLRVDDYRFNQGGPKGDNSTAYSLLRGGLRTITGAIGKVNPDGYKVDTPTSTVGIRGTHYVLRHCADDCPDGKGGNARNGTYGQVFEGGVYVANNGGTRDFTRGQAFYVADRNTPAVLLISAPNLLEDPLPGQGMTLRSNERDLAEGETLARSGLGAESRLNEPPYPIAGVAAVSSQNLDAYGNTRGIHCTTYFSLISYQNVTTCQ